MPAAPMRISAEEQRLLRALSIGQAVKLPSAHRLRLEMLGLLHDGPAGPRLTTLGRRHAEAALTDDETTRARGTETPAAPVKRDRLGRRMPHGRSLPF